jgi:hypothetical protein
MILNKEEDKDPNRKSFRMNIGRKEYHLKAMFGVITHADPEFSWMIGKSVNDAKMWFKSKLRRN